MYKAVIFDFDYTLGDSTKGIELSINSALERMGYPQADAGKVRRTVGLSLQETFKALTGNLEEEKAGLFAQYFKEKADTVMVENTSLYPAAEALLLDLRKNQCRTGIVTTKFHYRIEQILDKFNMRDAVDVIIGGEDVKAAKPDPEGLLSAIGKLQVDKGDVLYVGDSCVDAKTAQSAGVDFAAVLTGATHREAFETYENVGIFENLEGLCGYLNLAGE